MINVFSNFAPNKRVAFDDSEPPWMIDYIKNKKETPNIIKPTKWS